MAKENTLKAEEEHKIKDAVESDLGNWNPMVKGKIYSLNLYCLQML